MSEQPDIVRRADRWLASSLPGPAPAGLVMDLRNEIERLRADVKGLTAALLGSPHE